MRIITKPATYYLGLQISREEDGSVLINQASEKESSGKAESEFKKNENFPYREAVGALAYLMVGTRPDIAYAVGVVSRKLDCPSREDWLKVKRILRYIKGTKTFGIHYKAQHFPGVIEAFSDADHGGDHDTGRSTTGVVCRYFGGAISWLSQRQTSVAISTTEAELVAASEGARELVWLVWRGNC